MITKKFPYDYFRYTLPDKPSRHYADQAIKIIKEIKQEFPGQLHNFMAPSEVLTLSGVRAFDTYYELGEGIKAEEIIKLKALLKQHNILLLEESFPAGDDNDKTNRYSLLNLGAFDELKQRYGRIPGWLSFHPSKMRQDLDFFLWKECWNINIATKAWKNKQLAEWIKADWWNPHNITFGMLLGYPGEALVSFMYFEAFREDDRDYTDIFLSAKIKHAETEEGAWPIYDYLKELKDNPNIVGHQKLWSDILAAAYNELGSPE